MLVVKETETPEIVHRTIEAILDAYDKQVGGAERHFLAVAGVIRDDEPTELAWLSCIGAIGEMWQAAALACFQVGQLHALSDHTMPATEAPLESILA